MDCERLTNVSFYDMSSGGNVDNPSWDFIFEKLRAIRHAVSGGVTYVDRGDLGSELQVRAERGDYIVTMLEFVNGEDNVRTFLDLSVPRGARVCHGGDFWDARMICRDFDFVVEVFKEFFDTGTVSKEKLL